MSIMLVECIDDKNWSAEALKYIKEFPVEKEIYTVIKRNHTAVAGMGYVLAELNNPPLPCGTPVGFSTKRFRVLPDIDVDELIKEKKEALAL